MKPPLPPSCVQLEFATTPELIGELAKRSAAMVFVHVANNHPVTVMYTHGYQCFCLGLLEQAAFNLKNNNSAMIKPTNPDDRPNPNI